MPRKESPCPTLGTKSQAPLTGVPSRPQAPAARTPAAPGPARRSPPGPAVARARGASRSRTRPRPGQRSLEAGPRGEACPPRRHRIPCVPGDRQVSLALRPGKAQESSRNPAPTLRDTRGERCRATRGSTHLQALLPTCRATRRHPGAPGPRGGGGGARGAEPARLESARIKPRNAPGLPGLAATTGAEASSSPQLAVAESRSRQKSRLKPAEP